MPEDKGVGGIIGNGFKLLGGGTEFGREISEENKLPVECPLVTGSSVDEDTSEHPEVGLQLLVVVTVVL